MKIGSLSSILVCVLVSGCAMSYPPLFTPPYAAPATPSILDRILAQAAVSQTTYATYYKKSAKQADISQLPIIGAASLAAGVLYRGNGKAQDHLAAIGIGVGGYTAYRDTIFPTSLPELYLKGHSALGCIRSEGIYFTGDSAIGTKENAAELSDQLTQELIVARQQYKSAKLSSKASAAIREQFQNASSALNEAINSGNQTLLATQKQLASFANSETVFGLAVSNVHYNVATAARKGRSESFADIRSAISANIGSAGGAVDGAQAPGVGPKTDAATIANLLASSSSLILLTQQVSASTPDYIAKLERVAECPKIVS